MKILIIQTAFIGDVVLATPLIEKLASANPDAEIDFLLRKGNENLLEYHPKLNRVLVWKKKEQKFKNLIKLIKEIRHEKYDLLINLQRFGSTGLMTWLSGANEKVGFKKNPFSFSYDYSHTHEIGNGTHEIERNLKLIEKWTDTEVVKPKLYLSDETLKKTEFLKSKPYITLAPTSVWFTKQFPVEKWIEFLSELNFDGNIYLIGAPSDKEACQRMIDASGKGENLCGQLSLIESVGLIKDAQMNYVNDSAPMHFASAVNAPTCAIFCSTVPSFGFGPLSDNSSIVEIEENLSCRPCGLHGKRECPEGHFKCGKNIDVKRLTQLLDN
jgi:lipopolysaccharide heptosyltransferase II